MKNIVVYCGSNLGNTPAYYQAACDMGKAIAARGSRVVYGGGKIGLMGTVADAAMQAGGEVIGVIPTFLREKEVAHTGLTRLIETPDMTTRKNQMIALADAFIAMPGGLGTYEELFEVLSQAQLRLHDKPVGVLNINGFFDALLAMMQQTADAGFMPQANMSLLCVAETPAQLLQEMAAYRFVEAQKWVTPSWQNAAESTS
ncbi:TIGR00730 family Rossman fold protein [Uruburuella testudinis]|uniref:Cytokinin riboside 5'-monophosphate phosphoribohydrolase n=1 Tax=Uruburuella testudinis TaxID=1282863 RepID=A0ABY4DQT3_9NEIS|nr:TIGR00730 family Rossman fold protein [Uruburuella testudinis]UOO81308.1 TIGR00730 family Rossman fold protein [Uruburuella testudinis]